MILETISEEGELMAGERKGGGIPFVGRRKLMSAGDSTVVVVPTEWLKQHGLKKGDNVILVANSSLKILPESKEVIQELHKLLEKA